jgi:hypothetical protein
MAKIIGLLLLIVLIALWGASSIYTSSCECRVEATVLHRQYIWGIIQGCMVQEKTGEWVSINRINQGERLRNSLGSGVWRCH